MMKKPLAFAKSSPEIWDQESDQFCFIKTIKHVLQGKKNHKRRKLHSRPLAFYLLNSLNYHQIQLDSCPWKEHKADTGRIYYHNTETKESTWTIPKELAELKGKYYAN